jgi:hypothetical protein
LVVALVVIAMGAAALGGGLIALQRFVASGPRGSADEHAFIRQGMRARWNPCEPIHYVVNPGLAPAGSIEDVHEAVRRVSSATGIPFEYDGLSDEVPGRGRGSYVPSLYGHRWAPVLIAWVDPQRTDITFERNGHTAAAVAAPLSPLVDSDVLVSGWVAINQHDPNPPGFAHPGDQGPVLLHELGHIMGLGHVEAVGEIMESSGGAVTDFGPGDLEGLRLLGRAQGCLVVPRPDL